MEEPAAPLGPQLPPDVLEIQPNNVEATRELRLITMRKDKKGKATSRFRFPFGGN